MAEGGWYWGGSPVATNKWTNGKHWRLSVGVSTVLEHTERAVRMRGDCPIVNRLQMVSLSWAGKKSVRDDDNNNNNSNKNKNVSRPGKVYVWETLPCTAFKRLRKTWQKSTENVGCFNFCLCNSNYFSHLPSQSKISLNLEPGLNLVVLNFGRNSTAS